MLDLGALLRVPCVEAEMGYDLAPDGRRLAFSSNPGGRWEVFEIALGDGPASPADLRPITRGPGSKFSPRYSPDGRSLAYVVDLDGSEHYHIVLHDLASGAQTDLTAGVRSSLQAFFAWSPDGREIAFISDEAGQFDVYVMPVEGGWQKARLSLDVGHPAWKVHWSPDGQRLAVTVEGRGQDYGTYIHTLADGKTFQIAVEGKPINAKDAAWSPDSRRLAFCSDVDGDYDVGICELPDGRITWVTVGEGQKQSPAWSPDGRSLTYTLTRGAVSWLAVQEAPAAGRPAGAEPRLHQIEPGVLYIPRFAPDGRSILFAFDNPRRPTDVWRLAPDGSAHQLTRSLPEALAGLPLPMPVEVCYPSLDGSPVPAMLFRAQAARPGPAVLIIHGGPDWHFEMTWYPIMAAMSDRGWTVLVPNFRGSTGYGRAWQLASRFDYGGVDADDVAAGAHYLAREGLADPARIAVTGRSHGGYLTACCLTRFPDLWAAGSALVPYLNWFTNHNEIRPDLQKWDLENFGDPVRDYERWRERSPSFFLDRIRAPLQLICGRQDARCPVSDSIEAYETLTRLGKEAELIIYEDEGHSFLKIENVLDSETRRIEFLARCLDR